MAKISLGICGSIAAYRSPDLVKALKSEGHEIQCIVTKSALEFVTLKTLETFSESPVLHFNPFDPSHFATQHIAAARWADLFLIYGATANTLAKLANGIADDFLTVQVLAFEGPVFVAPAMNPAMWKHPAVQENLAKISSFGYQILGPISGVMACGENGIGHIEEIPTIVATIEKTTSGKKLSALQKLRKKILISAGPMRSEVDPVRYLQNSSSGTMALELAKSAKRLGHTVTVLLGPVDKNVEKNFEEFTTIPFTNAASYKSALLKNFKDCDIFISAAAVLDFEVKKSSTKISRKSLSKKHTLNLKISPVPDFASMVSKIKRQDQTVIAFALEDGKPDEILNKATYKLKTKNVDCVIANEASSTSGPFSDKNKMWILKKNMAPLSLGYDSKKTQAQKIVTFLEENLISSEK